MGLDIVELVQEIETAFGIEIPDQVAENIITVGDMYDAMWEIIEETQKLDQMKFKRGIVFYRVKDYFIANFHVQNQDFFLGNTLQNILPKKDRQNKLNKITRELGLEIPVIVLPEKLTILLVTLVILVGVIEIPIFIYPAIFGNNTWIFVICGMVVFTQLTRFLSSYFMKRNLYASFMDMTIYDLIEAVEDNHFFMEDTSDLQNRKEMEDLTRKIIVDKLGVNESRVVPEARFVEDLKTDQILLD